MKSVEQFTQKEIEMMEFREKLFLEQVEQYRAAVTVNRRVFFRLCVMKMEFTVKKRHGT